MNTERRENMREGIKDHHEVQHAAKKLKLEKQQEDMIANSGWKTRGTVDFCVDADEEDSLVSWHPLVIRPYKESPIADEPPPPRAQGKS